jgi:hypothetical protein
VLYSKFSNQVYYSICASILWGYPSLAEIYCINPCNAFFRCRHLNFQPTFTSDLRQSLRLGLVLTFLLVLMTTHVGTGLFCLVRFINLFLREVFFRAAMYDLRINFLLFLSVGVIVELCDITNQVCTIDMRLIWNIPILVSM